MNTRASSHPILSILDSVLWSHVWVSFYLHICGYLNENVPHSLKHLNTWPLVGGIVWGGNVEAQPCWTKSTLLVVRFTSTKLYPDSSLLSLLHVCGSAVHTQLPVLAAILTACGHGSLPWSTCSLWNHSQKKLLLLELLLLMVLCHSNRR